MILIISFQNFSLVNMDELKPELASARAARTNEGLNDRGDQDIRDFAPSRPAGFGASNIAVPEAGRDPGTIGLNWLGKQTTLMTDGADQRLLQDFNHSLNRLVKFEPVQGEPWPDPNSPDDPAAARSPAADGSGAGDDDGGGDGDKSAPTPTVPKAIRDMFSMAPHSLHFSQLNKFEMQFATDTKLSCLVGGGGVEFDVKKPLSERLDVGLRHRTAEQSNTVHMSYSW